jgi:hypothetical protein
MINLSHHLLDLVPREVQILFLYCVYIPLLALVAGHIILILLPSYSTLSDNLKFFCSKSSYNKLSCPSHSSLPFSICALCDHKAGC